MNHNQTSPSKAPLEGICLSCTEKMIRGSRVENHLSGVLSVYSRSCC
ncbi:hypothetical protein ES288_A13G238100v1 [Gossypium darwinii]|uniref:Uncharacterized protein n=1 Tax=Gossypium darwinii TaxID=34276 RepID=A0A5D2E2P4_GOSDA|nr:hypothetical protein ES288_A13G238100v1 [Gossypium darwinii]